MNRQTRLYIAGGAALLVAVVLGIGAAKIIRGSPPPAHRVAGPVDEHHADDLGGQA